MTTLVQITCVPLMVSHVFALSVMSRWRLAKGAESQPRLRLKRDISNIFKFHTHRTIIKTPHMQNGMQEVLWQDPG